MKFQASDYSPLVYGSGAEKLADSQVAPLVAAVRGYRSYSASDGEKKSPATRIREASSIDARGANTFAAATASQWFRDGGDAMLIPWFSLAIVLDTVDRMAAPSCVQVRPEHARVNKKTNKPLKYEFTKNANIPISLHPAYTRDWADAAQTRIVITEGVLKEDALTTGMLRAAGITNDELAAPNDRSVDQMRLWVQDVGLARLRTLLERVPKDQRVLPLGVAGVNGWKATQLSTLHLHGREVTIAFDGDVKSNPNVWTQAQRLWELIGDRGGKPSILALGGSAALMEIRSSDKFKEYNDKDDDGRAILLGVDDYLSHIGTYPQLMAHISSELPAEPERVGAGFKNGEWRVTNDGFGTEEYRSGGEFDGSWVPRIPIGGYVESVAISRVPTLEEVRKSTIFESADRVVKQRANIVLRWRDPGNAEEQEVRFTIDLADLNTPPTGWRREAKDLIPPKLGMHPDWPPKSPADGSNWVAAIKRNSGDNWMARRAWEVTGWVPCDDGVPAYLIGDQVLGESREIEATTTCGADGGLIPSAQDYGVQDTWWDRVDPDGNGQISQDGLAQYKRELVDDIENVVRNFLHSSVWSDGHFGPAILATALRPAIPRRTHMVMFLGGPPGTGKSWVAGMAMGAWQKAPKVWGAQHLPGSATSTGFAMELISASCGGGLLVIDDLAPSVSQQGATNQESGMENLVRAVFNSSSRQRGTKEGGLAKSADPRATLMITAENSLTSTSVLERMIELKLRDGLTDSDQAHKLIETSIDSLALSRVAAAMIRFWFQPHPVGDTESLIPSGQAVSWSEKIDNLDATYSAIVRNLSDILDHKFGLESGSSARRVGLIAELVLPLVYLNRLYVWAGGVDPHIQLALVTYRHDKFDQVLKLMKKYGDAKDPKSVATSAMAELAMLASSQLGQLSERKVGASLRRALAASLQRHAGYLANPFDPAAPPFAGTQFAGLATRIGWTFTRGEWTPKGVQIGWAGEDPDNPGRPIAVLHSDNAFDVAKRNYSELVPHGQKASSSWRAMIAEGIADPVSEGTNSYSRQSSRFGDGRRGVWISMNQLLSDLPTIPNEKG